MERRNDSNNAITRKKGVIALLCLLIVFSGIFVVLRLTFFDERADILNRLFTQPQWNNYNFASATGKMSIAPV
ncbi:MAG: hypothetical protein LBH86_08595, partial [Oscillospiraceae bacterium]|nr:hypothetical protein [Oscillospiraceae bacterium]